MAAALDHILGLEVRERIRIAQAIWDSVAARPEDVPLTDAERAELDRRLDAHAREPDAGAPWTEVKARLLGAG